MEQQKQGQQCQGTPVTEHTVALIYSPNTAKYLLGKGFWNLKNRTLSVPTESPYTNVDK